MKLFRCAAVSFFGFTLLLCAALGIPRGHYILVIGNPWAQPRSMMDIIGEAGGVLVSQGRSPWLAVAYSGNDDFAMRLMKAGAILVLNHKLAEGCQQKDT